MSCTIELKDQTILKTSVGVFESLFYEFNKRIEEENIDLNEDFKVFLEKLDKSSLTLGGVCIDIAKIFHSSDNVKLLIHLLEEAILKIGCELRERALDNLWKFHAELVKYKEELEAQGK